MSTAPASAGRVGEIDALRGLAAVAVMLFHYTTRVTELYPGLGPATVGLPQGHYGVNLFFIISGYVIFMTLHRTRRPMDFVVSRFSRLFPAYWAAVFITFCITHAWGLPGKLVSGTDALGNLMMIHNFFRIPHVDGVYWTLEVELLFYAGMFSLYLANMLRRIHTVLWALLALRMVYHLSLVLAGTDLPWTAYRLLILGYIPWFAIGISIFLLVQPRDTEDFRRSLWTIGASLVVLAIVVSPAVSVLSAVMAAVVWAAASRRLPWLSHPVMVWLGAISYTLYLLHENIGWAFMLRLHDWGVPRDVGIVLAITLSLFLATALTRTVELPAMAWIRRRWRERQGR